MKKYKYKLRCYPGSMFLFLFERIDNIDVCIYRSYSFLDIYDYILGNDIRFCDIKLENFNFNDLFEHFVDRKSIDTNYIERGVKI